MNSANTARASTLQAPRPNLAVWRFVDGKRGHERQTEGLLRALDEFVQLTETVIPLSNGIAGWAPQLRRLSKRRENPPDLLAGAGHKTHLPMILCRLFTKKAKSVVLMKPSLPRCCFDFCVASSHDSVSASDGRALIIRGVLNPIRPSRNHDAKKGLILIGGPCRHVQWSNDAIFRQVKQAAAQAPDVQWIATTSRRTPDLLCEKLRSLAIPNLRYVPPTKTDPNWMQKHLGCAAQTWVSPDSVSMIHEALTAGCLVRVFDLPLKKRSKWKTALEELARDGWVSFHSQLNAGSGGGGGASKLGEFNEARRAALWLLKSLFPTSNDGFPE